MGRVKCPECGSGNIVREERCKICGTVFPAEAIANNPYPQDAEEDEFRYLSPLWLNEIARGLTAGAQRHPGETWRTIPAKEHAWRAVRHLIKYLQGDKADNHLIHASMRVMMAWETDKAENSTIEWERLP